MKELKRVGRASGPARELKPVGRLGKEAANAKPLEEVLVADLEEVKVHLDSGGETMGEMMKRVAAGLDAEIQTDYWTCLVFQSHEQLLAFLKGLGWDVDRDGDTYLDGRRIAKLLKVELPVDPTWKEAKVKAPFAPFALKPGER